ncbi:MAG TPA: CpsD/CapB family tyrosine-protein kinase [Steroidobacteraceae bacterium]|jgi:receptor protein-tyrosine kinase
MNAETSSTLAEISDEEIHKALVVLYSLSSEALENIYTLMRQEHLRFAPAALQANAITKDELEEALEWIRQQAVKHQGPGLIEEVLRRSARRELTVWEGPQLRPSHRLLLAHDPNHPRSESIRNLRTELLLRTRNVGTGFFALLSPCAAEGRSQLTAELAIAFAQLGRRTLLVDADLRKPQQHLLFGAENDVGLSQALMEGGSSRLHAVEGLPQMKLMTSGALPPNPVELLSGIQFERLVAEWRRRFEFVLLDTSPAASSSDAIAVASAVGNVLVLSRANVTPFSALREMSRRLETTYARTLGAVINKF